jgi:hypothetical protein
MHQMPVDDALREVIQFTGGDISTTTEYEMDLLWLYQRTLERPNLRLMGDIILAHMTEEARVRNAKS